MKAAGAIPVGRTNLPSGAVRWHTESELWGATINPWDRTRTPGASSAGEAAAIATGMSPIGLGSDGLGSLRHPAQCCCIAALKPTLGRIPHATTIEPEYAAIGMQLTAVYGPLARRVADLRAAFGVLAGPTWRDPWTVPAPLRGPEHSKPANVLIDTARVPALLLAEGAQVTVASVRNRAAAHRTARTDRATRRLTNRHLRQDDPTSGPNRGRSGWVLGMQSACPRILAPCPFDSITS